MSNRVRMLCTACLVFGIAIACASPAVQASEVVVHNFALGPFAQQPQFTGSPTAGQDAGSGTKVSGKITAVAKDSFTLAVAGQTGQQFAQEAPRPKSITFFIDKQTTIEGKLQVNANAEVTYRVDNGRNIAIIVRVTP